MKTAVRLMMAVSVLALAFSLACGGGGGSSPAITTSGGTTPPPPLPQILTITTPLLLPLAVQGLPYSTTFTASGGQGALHWSIAPAFSGPLPITGLTMDPNTGVLSGTANFLGTSAFKTTVTDSSTPAKTATQIFNLTANPPLSVSPANTFNVLEFFPDQGVNIFITGGVAPFKVSLDRSCLPPGMRPNPANVAVRNQLATIVVGGAIALGTYTCNVTVQDSFASRELVSQALTITVSPHNLLVAGAVPSRLLLNRPMSARIFALGGTPPYTLKQLSASLPTGLSFDPTTGILSGTPTTSGGYSLFVSASDSSSPAQSAVQNFSGAVGQPLGRNDKPATATPLPDAPSPFATVAAAGSISPYIDPPNGTPAPGDQDYYQVRSLGGATVHVETSSIFSLLDTVIEIVDGNGVRFSTCRQPGDTSTNFISSCVNDDIVPGNLNSALDFQVPLPTTATTNFYVHVLDFRGDARPDMSYTLQLSGLVSPLSILTKSLSPAARGFAYSQFLAQSSGQGAITWSVGSGSLPPGLSLSANGAFSGTATTNGTFSFTVRATDSSNPPQTATAAEQIVVVDPIAIISPATLAAACLNQPYTFQVQTSGGAPPITFGFNSNSFPINMNSLGLFSGTPGVMGTFTGQLTAIDATSVASNAASVASQTVSLTVKTCP